MSWKSWSVFEIHDQSVMDFYMIAYVHDHIQLV